jgi:hypothetical protein
MVLLWLKCDFPPVTLRVLTARDISSFFTKPHKGTSSQNTFLPHDVCQSDILNLWPNLSGFSLQCMSSASISICLEWNPLLETFSHRCHYCCLWDTWTGAVMVTVTNHIISTPHLWNKFLKILRYLNFHWFRTILSPSSCFPQLRLAEHPQTILHNRHTSFSISPQHPLELFHAPWRAQLPYIPPIRGKVRTKFPYVLLGKWR